eukprot:GHVL01001491.1.p1 GENE.GHVL01001491.1~~GHVL01001491.1.p1  ORF type:complete len:2293 (-),score=466.63 GHVL01001491.1:136-7014(-)
MTYYYIIFIIFVNIIYIIGGYNEVSDDFDTFKKNVLDVDDKDLIKLSKVNILNKEYYVPLQINTGKNGKILEDNNDGVFYTAKVNNEDRVLHFRKHINEYEILDSLLICGNYYRVKDLMTPDMIGSKYVALLKDCSSRMYSINESDDKTVTGNEEGVEKKSESDDKTVKTVSVSNLSVSFMDKPEYGKVDEKWSPVATLKQLFTFGHCGEHQACDEEDSNRFPQDKYVDFARQAFYQILQFLEFVHKANLVSHSITLESFVINYTNDMVHIRFFDFENFTAAVGPFHAGDTTRFRRTGAKGCWPETSRAYQGPECWGDIGVTGNPSKYIIQYEKTHPWLFLPFYSERFQIEDVIVHTLTQTEIQRNRIVYRFGHAGLKSHNYDIFMAAKLYINLICLDDPKLVNKNILELQEHYDPNKGGTFKGKVEGLVRDYTSDTAEYMLDGTKHLEETEGSLLDLEIMRAHCKSTGELPILQKMLSLIPDERMTPREAIDAMDKEFPELGVPYKDTMPPKERTKNWEGRYKEEFLQEFIRTTDFDQQAIDQVNDEEAAKNEKKEKIEQKPFPEFLPGPIHMNKSDNDLSSPPLLRRYEIANHRPIQEEPDEEDEEEEKEEDKFKPLPIQNKALRFEYFEEWMNSSDPTGDENWSIVFDVLSRCLSKETDCPPGIEKTFHYLKKEAKAHTSTTDEHASDRMMKLFTMFNGIWRSQFRRIWSQLTNLGAKMEEKGRENIFKNGNIDVNNILNEDQIPETTSTKSSTRKLLSQVEKPSSEYIQDAINNNMSIDYFVSKCPKNDNPKNDKKNDKKKNLLKDKNNLRKVSSPLEDALAETKFGWALTEPSTCVTCIGDPDARILFKAMYNVYEQFVTTIEVLDEVEAREIVEDAAKQITPVADETGNLVFTQNEQSPKGFWQLWKMQLLESSGHSFRKWVPLVKDGIDKPESKNGPLAHQLKIDVQALHKILLNEIPSPLKEKLESRYPCHSTKQVFLTDGCYNIWEYVDISLTNFIEDLLDAVRIYVKVTNRGILSESVWRADRNTGAATLMGATDFDGALKKELGIQSKDDDYYNVLHNTIAVRRTSEPRICFSNACGDETVIPPMHTSHTAMDEPDGLLMETASNFPIIQDQVSPPPAGTEPSVQRDFYIAQRLVNKKWVKEGKGKGFCPVADYFNGKDENVKQYLSSQYYREYGPFFGVSASWEMNWDPEAANASLDIRKNEKNQNAYCGVSDYSSKSRLKINDPDPDCSKGKENEWSPAMASTFKQVESGYTVSFFGYGFSGAGKSYLLLGNGLTGEDNNPGILQIAFTKWQKKFSSEVYTDGLPMDKLDEKNKFAAWINVAELYFTTTQSSNFDLENGTGRGIYIRYNVEKNDKKKKGYYKAHAQHMTPELEKKYGENAPNWAFCQDRIKFVCKQNGEVVDVSPSKCDEPGMIAEQVDLKDDPDRFEQSGCRDQDELFSGHDDAGGNWRTTPFKNTDKSNYFQKSLTEMDEGEKNVNKLLEIYNAVVLKRREDGRERGTPNNPESSRGHLFLLIKVRFPVPYGSLEEPKYGHVIINDLAGAEDPSLIVQPYLDFKEDSFLILNKKKLAVDLEMNAADQALNVDKFRDNVKFMVDSFNNQQMTLKPDALAEIIGIDDPKRNIQQPLIDWRHVALRPPAIDLKSNMNMLELIYKDNETLDKESKKWTIMMMQVDLNKPTPKYRRFSIDSVSEMYPCEEQKERCEEYLEYINKRLKNISSNTLKSEDECMTFTVTNSSGEDVLEDEKKKFMDAAKLIREQGMPLSYWIHNNIEDETVAVTVSEVLNKYKEAKCKLIWNNLDETLHQAAVAFVAEKVAKTMNEGFFINETLNQLQVYLNLVSGMWTWAKDATALMDAMMDYPWNHQAEEYYDAESSESVVSQIARTFVTNYSPIYKLTRFVGIASGWKRMGLEVTWRKPKVPSGAAGKDLKGTLTRERSAPKSAVKKMFAQGSETFLSEWLYLLVDGGSKKDPSRRAAILSDPTLEWSDKTELNMKAPSISPAGMTATEFDPENYTSVKNLMDDKNRIFAKVGAKMIRSVVENEDALRNFRKNLKLDDDDMRITGMFEKYDKSKFLCPGDDGLQCHVVRPLRRKLLLNRSYKSKHFHDFTKDLDYDPMDIRLDKYRGDPLGMWTLLDYFNTQLTPPVPKGQPKPRTKFTMIAALRREVKDIVCKGTRSTLEFADSINPMKEKFEYFSEMGVPDSQLGLFSMWNKQLVSYEEYHSRLQEARNCQKNGLEAYNEEVKFLKKYNKNSPILNQMHDELYGSDKGCPTSKLDSTSQE